MIPISFFLVAVRFVYRFFSFWWVMYVYVFFFSCLAVVFEALLLARCVPNSLGK